MTDHTIVAVYDTAAHAEAAVQALEAANVPSSAISRHSQGGTTSGATTSAAPAAGEERGFWSSLFGAEPDHDTAVYDRSMASGATVVSVKVPEDHHESVAAILESHNPIDIDERAESYGLRAGSTSGLSSSLGMSGETIGAATTGTDTLGTTGRDTLDVGETRDGVIRLAEESLEVGKRAVVGGTTRIRRYVVSTPVEKDISLHSERVVVERRPVAGTATTGAVDFSDRTIEMTETAEQAVVSKTARIVEEVALRKEASDRTETVRDTVRRQDVEIETVPGETTLTSTTGTLKTPASKV
ncbi:MAG: YsnF/AvaK domain-containing protein [Janthinobacterium lividum]